MVGIVPRCGYDFDQNVDKLPKSITHLTFGNVFNQNVDRLPNSITHLTFGGYFNQNIDKLPKSCSKPANPTL